MVMTKDQLPDFTKGELSFGKIKKFQYDIWGDTVNVANRMEAKSEVGKVNISAATYELINENYVELLRENPHLHI